jgi:16S rRNA (cytidine1402-2'-O)-methyltransferase
MSQLILVPTPLQEDLPLESVAHARLAEDALKEDVMILVEEHKEARRRWIKWGLPREVIEKFILFNEHTSEKLLPEIIQGLKSSKKAYLLSDCGLPAFCDPGQDLVDRCHKNKISVTSTPFANSVILAVALSGFSHSSFHFSGFVPVKSPQRELWLKNELKRNETMVWMETPYRLKKLLEELQPLSLNREIFLGMDLNGSEELLLRGPCHKLIALGDLLSKREFVMVVGPKISQ